MEAYKVTKANDTYKIGSIFIPLGTETLLCATFTEPHRFVYGSVIYNLLKRGMAVEINLLDEVKLYPHFYKPVKDQVKQALTTI